MFSPRARMNLSSIDMAILCRVLVLRMHMFVGLCVSLECASACAFSKDYDDRLPRQNYEKYMELLLVVYIINTSPEFSFC